MARTAGVPSSNATAEAAAALSRFRRILENNNRIIERIARLEQALGGEYIFDQAFLDSSLDQLAGLVREVIYSLNAISGQRYQGLYRRFTEIVNHLADLASGGPGPYDRQLVLPYHLLNRDLDYLVGGGFLPGLEVCLRSENRGEFNEFYVALRKGADAGAG